MEEKLVTKNDLLNKLRAYKTTPRSEEPRLNSSHNVISRMPSSA